MPCTREGLIRRYIAEVRLPPLVLLLYFILTELGLKPATGFCFVRLLVQSEYDVIVEDGIPRVLSQQDLQTRHRS